MRAMNHLADRVLDRLLRHDNASAAAVCLCPGGRGPCTVCVGGVKYCHYDDKCQEGHCLPYVCGRA